MWLIEKSAGEAINFVAVYASGEIGHTWEDATKIANEINAVMNKNTSDAVCEWTQQDNEESNNWESSCGDIFFFEEGTPEKNGMKFCPFCGYHIVQKPYEPDND